MDRLGRDEPGPDGPVTAASNPQGRAASASATTRRRGSEEATPRTGLAVLPTTRLLEGRPFDPAPDAATACSGALTIECTFAGRSFDPAGYWADGPGPGADPGRQPLDQVK